MQRIFFTTSIYIKMIMIIAIINVTITIISAIMIRKEIKLTTITVYIMSRSNHFLIIAF